MISLAKKKGKGGQLNPKKKWGDLSVKQREKVMAKAGEIYRAKRTVLKRPLNKNEKEKLIKTVKLGLWIPKEEIKQQFMNEFSHQENLIINLKTK